MLTNLLTNRIEKPLGFALGECPRLSWQDDTPGDVYSLTVASDSAFETVLYADENAQMNRVCYVLEGLDLAPRTRYFWRVTKGEDSAYSYFETGKMDEVWSARFITPDLDRAYHPEIFTTFDLPEQVISARAYVCGLGVYEISLNGAPASDERLAPGLCAYDKWLPYQTYDVTAQLRCGANELSFELGNGWYKGRYGLSRRQEFHYGEEFALLCELHITFQSGKSMCIASGIDGWQARRSTVISSGIFDGEVRDDTLDCAAVYAVKAADVDMSLLEARRSEPMRVMMEIKPQSLIKTPKGDLILDMGQNMVGVLAFYSRAKRGEKIKLQFGEVLQGDEFYRDNLRTALCEYEYTSDGVDRWIRPKFTFYGFRYVRLTGFGDAPSMDDFTGQVIYTQMARTGYLSTGSEKVNRLIENTLWGQRGNFLDTPTDCPQRDERMGWTGDAQVFSGTAAFNMDVYAFLSKYCYDMMKEQSTLDGAIPVVIPKHDVVQTGACAWGDAATIIPWNLYLHYGDKVQLSQLYPLMQGWVDYLHKRDDGSRLWKGDFHYGDWLALDVEDPVKERFGGTERLYLASCFYCYSARLVAKAARVIGREEDAAHYERLSGEVREAIVKEYVTPTGRLALTSQTAYILALYMDIIPEQYRERTAKALRIKLKESKYHLRTGFIGTSYLCRVLSETGGNDIAYRLLLQEDYPSWLYQVNMGATTIWERWNSILPDGSISDTGMNSLNHYSYGSIVEWIYRNVAGIAPMEEAPGFVKFRLAPQPDERLGSVKAKFMSPMGEIGSEWHFTAPREVAFSFSVPEGAQAEICLPDGSSRWVDGGAYTYTCTLDEISYEDMPVSEILASSLADDFRRKHSNLTSMMMFDELAGERSLNELADEGFDIREVQP